MESYPPLFRETRLTTLDPNPDPDPEPNPNLDVPSIDLQQLDPNEVGEACRDFGLFRLINHGIPSSLSARLYDESRRILSLPFGLKKDGFVDPIRYFWGTPALSLRTKDLNWVEGVHVQLGKFEVQGDETGDSNWCSSFRSLIHQYGQHMARIARTIFDTLSTDLGLDSSLSASYLSESEGVLRVYRYPCRPDTSNNLGMDAHTDSSVLSILNQDDVGGLQILHNNQWFNVAPVPGTLIVNLGDMMQAMSNDGYKSVEHRVLANRSKERMSLCYFAFPMEDGVIVSSRYKAFTYKEFSAQVKADTKAYGFKIGLQHFKVKSPG